MSGRLRRGEAGIEPDGDSKLASKIGPVLPRLAKKGLESALRVSLNGGSIVQVAVAIRPPRGGTAHCRFEIRAVVEWTGAGSSALWGLERNVRYRCLKWMHGPGPNGAPFVCPSSVLQRVEQR